MDATSAKSSPFSPRSIFGFEPINGSDGPQPGTLKTQRSLLAELLATAYTLEALEEDTEDYEDDDASPAASSSTLLPLRAGIAVPKSCASGRAGMLMDADAPCAEQSPCSSPIAIPNKTYYRTHTVAGARQEEERRRLQHQRQVYRAQQEANEQAALAAAQGRC